MMTGFRKPKEDKNLTRLTAAVAAAARKEGMKKPLSKGDRYLMIAVIALLPQVRCCRLSPISSVSISTPQTRLSARSSIR